MDIAHEAAQDLGLEIIEATVTGSAEVMQIAQSLIGKVDAFMFLPIMWLPHPFPVWWRLPRTMTYP